MKSKRVDERQDEFDDNVVAIKRVTKVVKVFVNNAVGLHSMNKRFKISGRGELYSNYDWPLLPVGLLYV